MKSPLKLVVIVATRNRSELLASRSLPSINNQSRKPDFLIVCDDSDTEYQRANESAVRNISISDSKVSYLRNSRTTGASGCWNSAVDYLLEQVNTPNNIVLAFLDDDDEWLQDYLQCCVGIMQTNELDMVAAGINRIEGNEVSPVQCPAPSALHTSSFLTGNPGIQGSNLFIRLSTFLAAGGFDEFLTSSTDRDFCIRLAEMGSVRYRAIPEYLVNHYAESNRKRLSTAGSASKINGLTAFWQKYHSRMSVKERTVFSQRAKDLFGWDLPETSEKEVQTNKAIVLVISVPLCGELLGWLVIFFRHFRNHDLVGLDCISIAPTESVDHQSFAPALRDLGIGCFQVETYEELFRYGHYVASLRPGSNIWWLGDLACVPIDHYIDSEIYLYKCGARSEFRKYAPKVLSTDSKATLANIHEQRIASAKHRVLHLFKLSSLRLLGSGSEAIVFTDGTTVYKCIDYWKTRTPKAQLDFLKNNGPRWQNIPGIYPLHSVIIDGAWVLITYPFENSVTYAGGYEERMIDLINGCTRAGIVCNNIHPKNLILTESEVKLIDYGSDIRPWTALGFEHMARRAYLSCYFAHRADLGKLMSESLANTDLPEFEGYDLFRVKLDYPVNRSCFRPTILESAPGHEPFMLTMGIITGDPMILMPLLSSLRVLQGHSSIESLSVIVLCNGCSANELSCLKNETIGEWLSVRCISEATQLSDAKSGYFGAEIFDRPSGQVGIAFARTMLQRYVGLELAKTHNSIGWLLDDDMRIDERACDYIGWLPAFRKQGVDVLLGSFDGCSPNPPLNGLRVQLMDLVHNIAWLSELPEDVILPDRTDLNDVARIKYPDYYYDLSRKHSAHLELPLWLEPSYEFETVKEARARLLAGSMGILNGTPLTRSIVSVQCENPLVEAKDSVNRGGCTFILNPDALLKTPNLIPSLNGKESRRSDMIWAIINRYYRGMTIKAVSFPVYHVGRTSDAPTVNPEKVQGEIVGSALYAGLTDFLSKNPHHQLFFTQEEVETIYTDSKLHMESRLRLLQQSFYRIAGLKNALYEGPFSQELTELILCLEQDFSLTALENIKSGIRKLSKKDISCFLGQINKSTDAYCGASINFQTQHPKMSVRDRTSRNWEL